MVGFLWTCVVPFITSLCLAEPIPKSAWVNSGGPRRVLKPGFQKRSPMYPRSNDPSQPLCNDNAPGVTAPYANIWAGLTDQEAASVLSYLFERSDLNLTTIEDAGAWDNYVINVELMIPNKTDVLAHIDGKGAAPTRYARVVLNYRATEQPYYSELLVGPLPLQPNVTAHQPLEFPYTRKTQGRIRDVRVPNSFMNRVGASIVDITLDLWNGTAVGAENDTLNIWGFDPLWQEGDRITSWFGFTYRPTNGYDGESVYPLGLFFYADITGRDRSKWSVIGWFYNNIYYETVEAFREAFNSPGFVKLGANKEGEWTKTDQAGPVHPEDTSTPPEAIAPAGSRYSVDTTQKYVEWMDFSFYIGFTRDTGMALYDIKYKGQRIMYELGLQEALAHYAGNDPIQSGTAYLDSYYGFGPYTFELVQGYDCPSYATYLNSSFYTRETTHTHVNSICLFEFNADYPIQRHSTSSRVSVTKNVYFSVRSVSTIGNYDYMFTYSFYMDGSIGVEVRASGYIQAAFYANNEDYGWKIHDNLSGSLHDHVMNFKADFDILGTANTVEVVTIKPVTEKYPWSQNKTRNTMKVTKEFIENEDSSRLNWAANSASQVLIVNKDKPNKYGEYRGYRVLPSTGTVHLTVEDSTNLMNAANWANHDIQITQQHDYEPRSAHAYATQDVQNPPINFDEFFNGESLVQEDLVMWLTLGMHHMPHTGDLPNTVFTTAHSGVHFMPLNYLLSDPSRETVNQVRIDYEDGNVSVVETFGHKDDTCTEASLWDYGGDVVVRKYPFDVNNSTDSITK